MTIDCKQVKIDELHLSNRALHALMRGGIFTIDQLMGKTADDLQRMSSIGKESANEILEKMSIWRKKIFVIKRSI